MQVLQQPMRRTQKRHNQLLCTFYSAGTIFSARISPILFFQNTTQVRSTSRGHRLSVFFCRSHHWSRQVSVRSHGHCGIVTANSRCVVSPSGLIVWCGCLEDYSVKTAPLCRGGHTFFRNQSGLDNRLACGRHEALFLHNPKHVCPFFTCAGSKNCFHFAAFNMWHHVAAWSFTFFFYFARKSTVLHGACYKVLISSVQLPVIYI